MRKYVNLAVIVIGLLGAIASIISGNTKFMFISFGILLCGIIIGSIIYIKKHYGKMTKLTYSWHPGFFAVRDLAEKKDNQDIEIIKFTKNVKYSDKNTTSNVTCIIDGKIKSDPCKGLFFTISAASLTTNIKRIGYSLILDETKMIDDRFQFIDNSNLDKLLHFSKDYTVSSETPNAKRLYLPFSVFLERGKRFQAVLYYTWEKSIVDLTDSTSYHLSTTFPKGVNKLVTNLVFTSKPCDVVLYKVHGNRKKMISAVPLVKKEDDLYYVRLEMDNPNGIFILQRTLEKWS